MAETQWRIIGQIFATFILVEFGNDILVVDQHTAHERILFERFKNMYSRRDIPSQTLMFPVTVELDPSQTGAVKNSLEHLQSMGVQIEEFGHCAFLIRALPEHLKTESPELILKNIADDLVEVGRSDFNREAERRLLITLSCHRAIRAGDYLSSEQMRHLLKNLMEYQLPSTCPHGRPIVVRVPRQEFERRF